MSIVKRLGFMTVTLCVSVTVLSYFGDCVLNLQQALRNIAFLIAYLWMHFILHTYIILPVLFFYLIVLGRVSGYIIIKIAFLMLIFLFVAKYFSPDELNLTIGWYGKVKQTLSWCLGGATTVLIDEFYIQRKFGNKEIANAS